MSSPPLHRPKCSLVNTRSRATRWMLTLTLGRTFYCSISILSLTVKYARRVGCMHTSSEDYQRQVSTHLHLNCQRHINPFLGEMQFVFEYHYEQLRRNCFWLRSNDDSSVDVHRTPIRAQQIAKRSCCTFKCPKWVGCFFAIQRLGAITEIALFQLECNERMCFPDQIN